MEATAPVAAIDTDAPFPVRSPTETAGFWLPPSRVLVTLPPAPTAPLLTIWLMFPNVGVLNESELIELTDTAAWAPTAETEAVAPAAKPPPSVKSPLLLTAAWFCVTDWTCVVDRDRLDAIAQPSRCHHDGQPLGEVPQHVEGHRAVTEDDRRLEHRGRHGPVEQHLTDLDARGEVHRQVRALGMQPAEVDDAPHPGLARRRDEALR